MTTHAEFAQLLAADCSPLNLHVYADWLEEAGDEKAAGVRWLAENGKRPDKYIHRRFGSTKVPWEWWREDGTAPAKWQFLAEVLPAELIDAMPETVPTEHWRSFATVIEAVDAAALAWAQTREGVGA